MSDLNGSKGETSSSRVTNENLQTQNNTAGNLVLKYFFQFLFNLIKNHDFSFSADILLWPKL